MLTYLFTASVLLFVFALGYYFFLKQAPQLALRRRVLLLGITGVTLLPLLPAPSIPPVLSTGSSPEQLVQEWVSFEPAAAFIPATSSVEEQVGAAAGAKSGWRTVPLITCAYLLGVLLLLGRVMTGLFRLRRLRRESWSTGEAGIRLVSGGREAFTFGRTIYLSEAVYNSSDASVIIAHERAHAREWHTLDALAAEIFRAAFWFHPMAWWTREQVQLNLEYLADAAVLRAGFDRRAYQLSLVTHRQGTDFRTSLLPQFAAKGLKRRIQMMGFRAGSTVRSLMVAGLIVFLGLLTFTCMKGEGAEQLPEEVPSEEAPMIAPLFNGEATELNVYFKRLPTPEEVAKIRPYLKEYFSTDLKVYQSCTEPAGSYQLYLGPDNTTATGSTNWTTDHYSDQPIRFQLTKNGAGSTGGSTFRPLPAPADAPDEDVFLNINGEWIAVAVPDSDLYTAATLDRPVLAVDLECRLGLTPENKDDYNIWRASLSVQAGDATMDVANTSLAAGKMSSLPRTYYLGDRPVDEKTFASHRQGERHMLYLAARTDGPEDAVVLMMAE